MTMIEQLKACVNIATSENEFRTQLLAYIDCMSDFGKLVDELAEENEQLRKENKDLQTRNHIVPEHYLSEAIDRCNELEKQIEEMKNFVKSMYEANNNDAYCREYLGTILNEWGD